MAGTGGGLARRLKQPEKGVPYLTHAVDVDPGHSSSWFYLARSQESLGDPRARASYTRYLALTDSADPKQSEKVVIARRFLDPESAPETGGAKTPKLPGLSQLDSKSL